MGVGASFEVDTQAPEVMPPGGRALDGPANFSQTAAMWLAASGDVYRNTTPAQDASVLVAIVAVIGIDTFRTAEWPATHPLDWFDRFDQGNQLSNIVAADTGQDGCEGSAVGIGGKVVFGAGSCAIGWVRTCFSPPRRHGSKRSRRLPRRSRSAWLYP